MTRSRLQEFAAARRLVGVNVLTLRQGESPCGVVVTSDMVVVALSVARRVDVRGGSKITHRGVRGLIFRRRPGTDLWSLDEVLDTTARLIEPEYELSFGFFTETEYVARRAHELMCYRPGTKTYPMDNTDRLAQGIK